MKRTPVLLIILLLLGLASWTSAALAQPSPAPVVEAVEAAGMTMADMERSVAFYTTVLTFEKVSDVEVTGSAYEHLQGVFGSRMRVVRIQLGEERIERGFLVRDADGHAMQMMER